MYSAPKDVEYRFYCEFQSHEPEFDYLKSLEIEEKINRIRWRHGRAGPLFLLSTNDKTIKLWKIYEKKVRMVSSRNVEVRRRSPSHTHAAARRACAPTTPRACSLVCWGLFPPKKDAGAVHNFE